MDEERRDDALIDEALRALRAELSVAPSPDFQARVRARLAPRRAPAMRWGWAVPAVAAAALVAALVWPRSQRTVPGAATAVEPSAPPPSTAGPEPTGEAPGPPPRPSFRRRFPAPERALVPAGEATRIARDAASVRERPFASDTLPHSDPSEPLAEPAPLEVAPLDTTPLVPDEGSMR
jgi:hypothetical protein